MLEGAPATHPLYHRGPCQARMKLCSNHKTCSNKLLKLLAFDKLLVRPHIENKWTVGFTEHRLDFVNADAAVLSGLILCQGNFLFDGDYSFGLAGILYFDSPSRTETRSARCCLGGQICKKAYLFADAPSLFNKLMISHKVQLFNAFGKIS